MGFKFSYVCDLLSSLESNRILKASTSSKYKNPDIPTVINWFNSHRKKIYGGETDLLALLSCLFPEKRPDRVYRLQEPSLVKIIGRCLLLGASRKRDLDAWKASGGGDLGQCVEIVMRQSENSIVEGNGVTIEEIDAALNGIASRCRYSGPKIRHNYAAVDVDAALSALFRRLSSRDAKWLTRMILKNYNPVVLPMNCALRNFHFLLPSLLPMQDSLEAAVQVLTSEPIKAFPPDPDQQYAKLLGNIAMNGLSPQIGIKVGRPAFYKARSVKHCCRLAERRKMCLERKYDGEYCQIHIDLDRGRSCIQIFSKSGKESTSDKAGVHEAIKQSLRIGQKDCKFSNRCILEGELLVWSDRHKSIQEFHKLRKHVSRAGKFIGIENDSPAHDHENLMIMFFDILLIDDNRCLVKPYNERRNLLKRTVRTLAGQAEIAEREHIDFASLDAHDRLTNAFSRAITKRWEGFVLKGLDEPYFTIQEFSSYRGRWIKLKKDYIPGLGDPADFAIIGARYDAKDSHKLGAVKPLLWTSFHVGCLENKEAVVNADAVPQFRVVDVLNHNNLNIRDIRTINQHGQFQTCDVDSETTPFGMKIDQDGLRDAEVVFKNPFVVEMLGSGFDKPQNVNYYQLRFPRVLKIHSDRTFEDATTFEELQQMAESSNSAPEDETAEEAAVWAQKLIKANGRSEYIVDSSQSSDISSIISTSTPRKNPLSPIPDRVQGLLPSSQSQADIGVDIGPRQERSKSKELSLGYDRHDATNRVVSCCETLPSKPAKKNDYKGADVAIFTETNTFLGAPPSDSPPIQEPHNCLTNVVNLGSQQKFQRESHTVAGANSTQVSLADDNTALPRIRLNMDIENQQSVTHKGVSIDHDKPSPPRTENSSSLHISTSSSFQVDAALSHEAPEPPWNKNNLPMLIGRFLFKKPNHPLQSILSALPSVNFSTKHFIDSTVAKWKEITGPSPSVRAEIPAIGIVIVDFSKDLINYTAEDMDAMGKHIAGHRERAPEPLDWPQKGKILFLHWNALKEQGSDGKSAWKNVEKSCFAGCVLWGYEGRRGYSVSGEMGGSRHRAKRTRITELEDEQDSFGYDVWASLDGREASSVRGYLGGY
ncbi:hypothetical protein FQN54_009802 [Arachnomyces sp. PD_36]|nr:hypothetical protein FQN54_009802 [Arachnomyces sp. PD_36]